MVAETHLLTLRDLNIASYSCERAELSLNKTIMGFFFIHECRNRPFRRLDPSRDTDDFGWVALKFESGKKRVPRPVVLSYVSLKVLRAGNVFSCRSVTQS